MITLKKIDEKNINLLNNLLQLYLHDVSLHFPIDLNSETCKYEYDDLNKYLDSSNNYAILFMDDSNVLGFTLIDSEDDSMVVQEMFILNNYKNKGLGEECIKKVFDELAPRYKDRNGGYTRIIKKGPRRGDAAEMAFIELV